MKKKDNIFSNPINQIVDFKFDDKVANVFEDMLHRSIPGYSNIIAMIGMLTKVYSQPGKNYYDLGSSLGAASLSMRQNITHQNCKIIAIDNSESMISRSRELIEKVESPIPVELICNNIEEIEINNAAIVVLNFTLQFIDPLERNKIISKIYNGLTEGGILILSEKVYFEESDHNKRQTQRYYDFKRLHGYSELEISQKRTALEDVLVSDSSETLTARLKESGFKNYDQWFQLFNFISIVAEK